MIRIVSSSKSDILFRLRKKLSLDEGLTTRRSNALTRKVFGKPLSPAEVVKTIIADVREEGDNAILRYTRLLDGVSLTPSSMAVPPKAIRKAYSKVPSVFVKAIKAASANILDYQSRIRMKGGPVIRKNGLSIDLKVEPIRRVGICVPGWSAPLPSSLMVTSLPALAAGVEEIVMVTPPSKSGEIDPSILVAADICGIDRIFRVGGSQALAGLAFGTDTLPKVDKIAGPGNIFVTLAKKELFGTVDIDMLAGPSEVLIIADETANPVFLASDLAAQAEHYPGSSVLLTPSRKLAEKVNIELSRLLPSLARKSMIEEDLRDFGLIVIVRDLDEAVRISGEFAPEHLQIVTRNSSGLAKKVRNAGAIFTGNYTPVALGDYFAGPSHTLPTGGSARAFSGVNVNQFLRTTAVITSTKSYMKKNGRLIGAIAQREGLTAHDLSVKLRE